jgi:hypothetical protein
VESIDELTPAEAFDQLARLEPRLRDLERELLLLVEGRGPRTDDEEPQVWDLIETRSEGLVGPWGPARDALLRSLTAFGMCRLHLGRLVGQTIDDSH